MNETKTTPAQSSISAATDVGEFLTDLDGGQFERALSIALSRVASHTVDNVKPGEVSIKFKVVPIKGTFQVDVQTELKFTHPTMSGKAMEMANSASVLHVGKFGRLTLAQQPLIGKQGELPGS